jgi:hypothetical protein
MPDWRKAAAAIAEEIEQEEDEAEIADRPQFDDEESEEAEEDGNATRVNVNAMWNDE